MSPTTPTSPALRLRPTVLVLAVWSVPACVAMLGRFFEWRLAGGTDDLLVSLLAGALPWYTWAALTPAVARVAHRRPLAVPLDVATVRFHVLASLALGHVYAGVGMVWVMVQTGRTLAQVYAQFLPIILPLGLLGYWGITVLVSWREANRRLAEQTVQAARAEARLSRARLDALRAQLNPHFLFNTLNSISALVRRRDPARATAMIARLGDLLRRTLDGDPSQEVSLDVELQLVRDYLAIEQERLGERLVVRWDVPGELAGAAVPSMILQPLVENAVLHGVAPVEERCTLRIDARRQEDALVLGVTNDGAPFAAEGAALPAAFGSADGRSPGASGSGVGLANVRARIGELYAARGALEVTARPGGGTVVRLVLPYRPLGAGAPPTP